MNAEFLVLASFFWCCQGGEALCLAVAQILIMLIAGAQQRLCYPFYCCWTAVGAAIYTTARVNAARFSAVRVDVLLPILLLLVPAFTQPAGVNAARFSVVGVGVMLPVLLLLVPPFTLRLG